MTEKEIEEKILKDIYDLDENRGWCIKGTYQIIEETEEFENVKKAISLSFKAGKQEAEKESEEEIKRLNKVIDAYLENWKSEVKDLKQQLEVKDKKFLEFLMSIKARVGGNAYIRVEDKIQTLSNVNNHTEPSESGARIKEGSSNSKEEQMQVRQAWLKRYKKVITSASNCDDDTILNVCLCNDTMRIEELQEKEDNISKEVAFAKKENEVCEKIENINEILDLQLRNVYHNVDECLCCEQTKENVYEIKEKLKALSKINNQQTKQTEQEKYLGIEGTSEQEKINLRGLGEKSSLSHMNKTADNEPENPTEEGIGRSEKVEDCKKHSGRVQPLASGSSNSKEERPSQKFRDAIVKAGLVGLTFNEKENEICECGHYIESHYPDKKCHYKNCNCQKFSPKKTKGDDGK